MKFQSSPISNMVTTTTFTGRLIRETRVGDYKAVVPTLSGQAWITGFANYVVDPDDPTRVIPLWPQLKLFHRYRFYRIFHDAPGLPDVDGQAPGVEERARHRAREQGRRILHGHGVGLYH